MIDFKVNDRVKVSAMAHGFGGDKYGTVTGVSQFMGQPIIDVKYDEPTPDGRPGITLTNTSLIEKINK